ncbi:hypothetical protein ACVWXO_007760 [Bradyrhizobium sp. LM2.7]
MRHDQLSKRAGAAADVDPAQACLGFQPVEKDLADEAAPDPHHLLIGGTVVEAKFGHARLPGAWRAQGL